MAEGETRLEIRRLEDEDEIEQFYCGDKELDGFLKEDARRLEAQDVTRVYVAVIGRRVYGYMAILADTIELKTNERKKLKLKLKHDDPRQIPALKIGRLAIDKAFREEYRGTGKALMGLAFRNGLIVAETAGCRLLTVDAYLESVEFYEAKLGFIRNKFKAPATEQPPKPSKLVFLPTRKGMVGLIRSLRR
jgi:hypothetical protein